MISIETRLLLERLLLQRLSPQGICRTVGVGLRWLLGLIVHCLDTLRKGLYKPIARRMEVSTRKRGKMYTALPRSLLSIFPIFLAIGLSATLSGCDGGGGVGGGGGGGGGSTPGTTPAPTTATTSIVSTGPIIRFGSVVLNGIEFNTTQAEIRVEDRVVREDELRIGMRVVIEGVRDNNGVARATRVVFRKNVEGLIDNLDVVNNTLVVLGQTVLVDGLTVFDDRAQLSSISLSDLVVGQFVEVSGLVDANGIIMATRIERKADFIAGVTEVESRGTISSLNNNARTFVLGALTVNFSTAIVTVVGTLGNGAFVQVQGTQAVSRGIVTATRVTVEDPIVSGVTGAEIAIEGFVTTFASSTSFRVNGQAVNTTVQTVFENGTVADLAQNVRLEVEGQLDTNGTLAAAKISFRRRNGGAVRIEADVEAVTTTTVTLLGFVVRVDTLTQFKDDSGGERDFRFDRIRQGNRLEIRGVFDAQGNVMAARLRRRGPANEVVLQAPVDSVINPSLIIRGVEVRTDGTTEFEDSNERRITATQFFIAVKPGTLVKASGALLRGTPASIRATRVEVEELDKNDDL